MANVHFSVSKRRVIASTLVVSLLFSLSACKKNKSKNEFESGKEILETDPYFEAKINEFKIPLDPDKEVDFKLVQNYEYIDGFAVATYNIEYEMPEDRFDCIWELKTKSYINAECPREAVERLFVPKGRAYPKTTLF